MNNYQLSFGNDISICTGKENKNKRVNSVNYKNNSLNKRRRNTYNFHEKTFSYNDIDIKITSNKKSNKDSKKQSLSMNTINNKNKEEKLNNDIIEDFISEQDKKLALFNFVI